jgi:hypothetical protein
VAFLEDDNVSRAMTMPIYCPPGATKKLITAACAGFMTACSSTTYKTYDGAELSSSRIVTVNNSPRSAFWSFTDVYSVDGVRLEQPANAITASPGKHWYQVVVTRRSKAAMFFLQDAFYQEAICGFMLEAGPGTTYSLGVVDNGGLASTNEHNVYNASLGIEEAPANGVPIARQIPTECASLDLVKRGSFERLEPIVAKGFLCRATTDCQVEGTACIKEAGYMHGVCRTP